jgi:hypothetical protein
MGTGAVTRAEKRKGLHRTPGHRKRVCPRGTRTATPRLVGTDTAHSMHLCPRGRLTQRKRCAESDERQDASTHRRSLAAYVAPRNPSAHCSPVSPAEPAFTRGLGGQGGNATGLVVEFTTSENATRWTDGFALLRKVRQNKCPGGRGRSQPPREPMTSLHRRRPAFAAAACNACMMAQILVHVAQRASIVRHERAACEVRGAQDDTPITCVTREDCSSRGNCVNGRCHAARSHTRAKHTQRPHRPTARRTAGTHACAHMRTRS